MPPRIIVVLVRSFSCLLAGTVSLESLWMTQHRLLMPVNGPESIRFWRPEEIPASSFDFEWEQQCRCYLQYTERAQRYESDQVST